MALSAYHTAYLIVTEYDVTVRVAAAAEQEGKVDVLAGGDPIAWANEHAWIYGTQADWVAAVMSALDAGVPKWGADPAVITDQHILSFVQSQP